MPRSADVKAYCRAGLAAGQVLAGTQRRADAARHPGRAAAHALIPVQREVDVPQTGTFSGRSENLADRASTAAVEAAPARFRGHRPARAEDRFRDSRRGRPVAPESSLSGGRPDDCRDREARSLAGTGVENAGPSRKPASTSPPFVLHSEAPIIGVRSWVRRTFRATPDLLAPFVVVDLAFFARVGLHQLGGTGACMKAS